VFRHELPFDRSSLTRWRQRLGEEQLAALLQESLSVAHRSGALQPKDLERVVVDLKRRDGDRINPVLAAAGYNFRRLIRWLRLLLRQILAVLFAEILIDPA